MKLTIGQIHNIFVGLTALDQQLEKAVPAVRLKIGINLNRVRPIAEAFEKAQQRSIAQLSTEAATKQSGCPPETSAEVQARQSNLQNDMMDAIVGLRAAEEEIEVKTFQQAELNLDENPRVSGDTISRLMPVLDVG